MSSEHAPDEIPPNRAPYIYRWDMDKTYLATEFDTVKDLIRTAFQGPADKANVPGSAVLLRELRASSGGGAMIYFISGSPRQMRGVLSEKLRLDGIHFDGFILKDNLSNLLKGRFKALKEQVGYKLPALLQARAQAPLGSRETLFGDDAERDAFIYSLYADLLARRVDHDTLEAVFDVAGLYPDSRAAIVQGLQALETVDPVDRVLIHLERRSPPIRFDAYGPRVAPVYNYFQAALVLFQDGRLPASSVGRLATTLIEQYQFTERMLLRSFQDTLRRNILDYNAAQRLGAQALQTGVSQTVIDLFAREATEVNVQPQPSRPQTVPDYPALLARELKRHKIEKARRKKVSRRWWS
ncbi:MAG: phosphatase domain-containing protein [Bradymonadia bacterium]